MSEEQRSGKVEPSRARARASLGMEISVEPFANTLQVLVLQHPQEPDKELGSAGLLVRALETARLKVGLSWRSLRAVAGEQAIPSEWAVLYLGPKGKNYPGPVNFVNAKSDIVPAPTGLKGLIVLDGTWSQAKALWWRNSWLTKLKRVVLHPEQCSRYGNLRREPRAEALSTIESVALALSRLEPRGREVHLHLEDAFQRMLNEYQLRLKQARSSVIPGEPNS